MNITACCGKLLAGIAFHGKRTPKKPTRQRFPKLSGTFAVVFRCGRASSPDARSLFSSPAWQSLPVAGLPPATFAGAVS